jgi:hypothetical protein
MAAYEDENHDPFALSTVEPGLVGDVEETDSNGEIDNQPSIHEATDDLIPADDTGQSDAEVDTRGWWARTKESMGRHKGKIALGAVAASAVLTLTSNPWSEVKEEVLDAYPEVLVGVAASEVAFTAGAAAMVISVGGQVGNPLKIKERLPEIAAKANDSLMFKVGLWVNTVGAVGTAGSVAAGVIQLPPEAYPTLAVAVADIGLTVVVRKAMIEGVKNNAIQSQEQDVQQPSAE